MQLSTNVVILIMLAVLALVVITAFVLSQAGGTISRTEATRIFETHCSLYRDADCTWDVTKLSGFDEFVDSCQVLYGTGNRAFSCLYQFCCEQVTEPTCDYICLVCRGHLHMGIPTQDCLDEFRDNQCPGTCI